MQKRILGSTNLKISEIGFGGIPIQQIKQEEANKLIDQLIKQQVNFIDTARGYTISEELLGNALIGKRDKFIIATKSMAKSYQAMKADINTSLTNLKTNYIDLYQCHLVKNRDEYNLIMSEDGAYKALREAQTNGQIGHIGITVHSLDFLLTILEEMPFKTIQFPYNILETQGEELFRKAKAKDIGVIVMKPLAGGFLEDSDLALRFVLNNSNVSVAIPGMHTSTEIEKNVAVSKPIILSNAEKQKIKEIQETYSRDFCRRCGYCMPCPVGVEIPGSLMMVGYYTRYNLKEWAKSRYETFPKKASDCIACGKCLDKCPYDLNIIEKLKEVKNIFGK
ncbi:MAG: aldo/keto reductase [Erysipelotrichales bacterium]|nr:aldo/keto reductase [Erysipelotrichales bacterium]